MAGKKTLVLGASLKSSRYSNIAINRLRKYNHDVVAIGLRSGEVGDVSIETNLMSFTDVNTVTLYLNPSRQKGYYDYILSLNPKRVIFNPGTENSEFQNVLKQNNVPFIEACTLVLLSTGQY